MRLTSACKLVKQTNKTSKTNKKQKEKVHNFLTPGILKRVHLNLLEKGVLQMEVS